MTFIFIALMMVANGFQIQDKYGYCVKNDFKPMPYCKIQKKANELGKD